MLEKEILEVKKEEELQEKKNMEEYFYNEKNQKKSLFKSKIVYELIKKEDIKKYLLEELKELSKLMNIEFNSSIDIKGDLIKINIDTEDKALLIGRKGQTLAAISKFLKQKITTETDMYIKINIDIAKYKEASDKKLEILAQKLAKEVLNNGNEIKMDSMNAYQRRVVHNVLNKIKNIKTESVGEEPNRCVVIKKED